MFNFVCIHFMTTQYNKVLQDNGSKKPNIKKEKCVENVAVSNNELFGHGKIGQAWIGQAEYTSAFEITLLRMIKSCYKSNPIFGWILFSGMIYVLVSRNFYFTEDRKKKTETIAVRETGCNWHVWKDVWKLCFNLLRIIL